MKPEIDYIEKLAQIIDDKGLTEISIEDGEQAITIRKEVIVSAASPVVAAAPVAAPQVSAQTPAPEAKAPAASKKGTAITSPMVGTFYKSPSPDSDPFVTEGSDVKQGDVVCIIEAMKMMNEIKSDLSGKIVEICVEDGQPVEFGQVLMYVE